MNTQINKPKKSRPRWVVPAAAASVLILIAAGVTASVLVNQNLNNGAGPKPVPSAEKPLVVGSLYAAATFPGWTIPGEAISGTTISAGRDTAKDGAVSLRIDSETGASDAQSGISQVLNVQAETEYSFSAWYQSPVRDKKSPSVSASMGAADVQTFDFPQGEKDWTLATWSYTTGVGESQLPVAFSPGGPTTGFVLDQLQVAGPDGTAVPILNSSFEEFASPTGILNASLVMQTGDSNIDIGWFTESVDWTIADENGGEVSSGSTPMMGGLGSIPLSDEPQGFYNLTISDGADPASQITTAFMLLPSTADGNPVTDERFGVGAHIGEEYYIGSEVAAASLGLLGMRTDAYWGETEKTKGQFDFPLSYESSFPGFAASGLTVFPISNGTNELYDEGTIPVTDEAVRAYADYTAALVSQYSSPAVEIFNELNSKRFNDGACGVGAHCYLPLLRAAHEAVKATSPDTLIVGPANANQDDPYLTELYKIGGLNYLDVVSYHPYVATPEELTANIQQAQARIREYNNGADKPIWLSEFGTPSSSGQPSEITQASFLIKAEAIALSEGVEKLFWYDLVNDSTDPADHEGNFGLFRRPDVGVPAFEPKLSAMAQALMISKLAGKEPAGNEVASDSAFSYVYGAGASATRVAWATTPTTVVYPSSKPLIVTTAAGRATTLKPVDGLVSIELGEQPVFVDGEADAPK